MKESLVVANAWGMLRAFTPARIALGRLVPSPQTPLLALAKELG